MLDILSDFRGMTGKRTGTTRRERARRRAGHAERRRDATGEGEGRREVVARLVLRQHRVRVGLALGGVRRRDGVDDGLGLFVADFWEQKQC